jgi:phosphomethylpyrimidine synthase
VNFGRTFYDPAAESHAANPEETREEIVPQIEIPARGDEAVPEFAEGARRAPSGVKVAMREISQSPTRDFQGVVTENPPLRVYDTSGPYTDPAVKIDIRSRAEAVARWSGSRSAATRKLFGPRGAAARQRLSHRRSRGVREPARGQRTAGAIPRPERAARPSSGGNVSQMHYARKGIITPEMEYIATRETLGRGNPTLTL